MKKQMKVPDVIGLTLAEAKKIIEVEGINIKDISVTAPPRYKGCVFDDHSRVVKLLGTDDGKVELLVCNPNMN